MWKICRNNVHCNSHRRHKPMLFHIKIINKIPQMPDYRDYTERRSQNCQREWRTDSRHRYSWKHRCHRTTWKTCLIYSLHTHCSKTAPIMTNRFFTCSFIYLFSQQNTWFSWSASGYDVGNSFVINKFHYSGVTKYSLWLAPHWVRNTTSHQQPSEWSVLGQVEGRLLRSTKVCRSQGRSASEACSLIVSIPHLVAVIASSSINDWLK